MIEEECDECHAVCLKKDMHTIWVQQGTCDEDDATYSQIYCQKCFDQYENDLSNYRESKQPYDKRTM